MFDLWIEHVINETLPGWSKTSAFTIKGSFEIGIHVCIVQELCAEALDGRLEIRPRRISTNSEPLLDEARAMALEAWGNIHNSWGSVEIGVTASEGESFGGMTLAEDFLIFEAVDVNNRPVADLARAEKVLVTKLYGTLMPLIRYELADSLIIDAGPNPDRAFAV